MNDSQLLQSFATTRSADAFWQLVIRHAPVVYAAARQITLKQAIVSAGMPEQPIEQMMVDLIGRLPGDKERFITIDLDAVFKGIQPDYYLQPNDVIQVCAKTPTTAPANTK